MQNELEDLNQQLVNLYLKNLELLKKNHPSIFKELIDFDTALNSGQVKERYTLEYKDQEYFDILDLETNEYTYGFNSFLEAEKRLSQTELTRKHSIDLLKVDPNNNKLALMDTLGNILPLVDYINKNINFEKVTFTKVFKYVFLGVGCGVHIHELYKKIDSMNTLIIEPNLEIFRLSLFLVDYSIFKKDNKQLFLSVGENTQEREKTLKEFTSYHSYMNYNIKYHLFRIEYKYLLDEIIEFYSHNTPTAFSYQTVLQVLSRTIKFMHEKHNFLQKDLLEKHKPLKNKKVLIISAGPSIEENIDWIRDNQDKFIIICVDIILKKLEINNIVPDIVVSIDPKTIIIDFFDTKDKDFLKNSSIIFLSQQHEKLIEKIKHLNFYFSQVLPVSDEIGYFFSVPNVGTFSFAVALFLGANELYLVGSDAAFNQETGNRYAKDNGRIHMDSLEGSKESKKDGIISDYDVLEVKGNLKETVKTNRELLRFKKDYESFIITRRSDKENDPFTAYNLSDGVFIEGIISTQQEDVKVESFSKKEFSKKYLDDVSIVVKEFDFDDDIKTINQMISRVKKFDKVRISTKDDFLQKKLDMMIWILEQKKKMSNSNFGNLFLQFTELIDIYINFSLNLKQDNLYSKDFLNALKKYWCNALLSLLKDMKKMITL